MGTRRRRRADRAGRPPMRSPGRPPVGRREHTQRFWDAVARGLSSEEAGVAAGVSPAVGVRWFCEHGGMAPLSVLAPLSGRSLSFAEREEIALLGARDCGVREIARQLGRSRRRSRGSCAATRRPAGPAGVPGHDRRARRPKRTKLATNHALRS
jgi:hypothetical protein